MENRKNDRTFRDRLDEWSDKAGDFMDNMRDKASDLTDDMREKIDQRKDNTADRRNQDDLTDRLKNHQDRLGDRLQEKWDETKVRNNRLRDQVNADEAADYNSVTEDNNSLGKHPTPSAQEWENPRKDYDHAKERSTRIGHDLEDFNDRMRENGEEVSDRVQEGLDKAGDRVKEGWHDLADINDR